MYLCFISRQYQHFSFDSGKPGVVTVKVGPDAPEQTFNILKDPAFRFTSSARPCTVQPAGLSQQRKEYLQHNVQPHVRPAKRQYYQF